MVYSPTDQLFDPQQWEHWALLSTLLAGLGWGYGQAAAEDRRRRQARAGKTRAGKTRTGRDLRTRRQARPGLQVSSVQMHPARRMAQPRMVQAQKTQAQKTQARTAQARTAQTRMTGLRRPPAFGGRSPSAPVLDQRSTQPAPAAPPAHGSSTQAHNPEGVIVSEI
ncbi:MAG: hypothetical protein HC824_07925 [Synechococcales cyanobacterium RM1_1_8]|nr:hypothetical protein [Synechococcales cyanobacterium RM1_1_8]